MQLQMEAFPIVDEQNLQASGACQQHINNCQVSKYSKQVKQ